MDQSAAGQPQGKGMNEFHFLRPEWLWALLPLSFILLRLVQRNRGYSNWKDVIDAHLLHQLLKPVTPGSDRNPRVLLALAWLLAVVAMAGPTWEKIPPIKFQPDVPPLVLVLDLSRSMQARDLHPSRLAVAKARLHSLLQQLPPRPVGLVVYADQAHTAMPLTRDKKLIMRVLGELTPEIMPAQGSNSSDGLIQANNLLAQIQARRGDILLITDGADNSTDTAVKQLTDAGYQLSVMAIGTLAGSKIPDEDGRGYIIGKNGAVRVAVNEPLLRTLAESGNGSYALVNSSGKSISTILDGLGKAHHGSSDGKAGQGEVWHEHGPLFLLLILPLAIMAFRRGVIAALLLCLTLPSPKVEALSWDYLWWNSDQRGLRAMQDKKPWQARELFTDPLWRGIAQYRARDFQAALQSFSGLNSAPAHYNRGNTLMHLGRTQEAIQAYQRAIELKPDHADASFNLELIQHRMQQPPDSTTSRNDTDQTAQLPELPTPDKKESLYAEDLLDTPNAKELSQKSGEAPKDLDKIGHLGGGAMLIPGAEHPQGPESPSIGQGLDDGKEMKRESDRIARESRQAGDNQGGSESTTDSAENRFVDPSTTPTETDDAESASESPEKSSAAVAQTSEGTSPREKQEQELSEERKGEPQDSANLTPDQAAGSTPASSMNEEDMQAVRQWLNRIPESQSALLKEKFLREYRRRPKRRYGGDPW